MRFANAMGKAGLCALTLIGTAVAPQSARAADEPFIGEVMLVAFDFCPRNFLRADGSLLSIAQNQALFSLYGTTYGGNGISNFAIPDMRGRVLIGPGTGPGLPTVALGQVSGSATQTMTVNTMPTHSHAVNANNLDGDKPGPGGKLLAAAPTGGTGNETIYSTAAATVTMNPSMIAPSGSNAPFNTQDPTLGLTHCIAQFGIFPSRP
ncbi:tail fiber protein [Pseudotabrizicola sp. 4114]|uniref:phage tail protein n=1 Tax=Pseudotabrizicola sp. 4114 TaxID=2817731 RepID=UPI00285E42C9|nr:microcystin-dependent protein [Pseudorhodobacter sp. 4114]